MKDWLTIRWNNTQATGPAKSINKMCEVLDFAGITYTVYNYGVSNRRPHRRKGGGTNGGR